ncbi:MAG TPA: hypothetical protein VE650_00760, partial [Acetobacteraceae bacterium]|nr:hypothetical protein [Acetobacteraceae bacterium]
ERPEPSITGAAFWALMARWQVLDELAVQIIGGPPMTSTGKRPRFRLVGKQVETYHLLRAIDDHLAGLYRDAAWLSRPNKDKPFARKTPIAFMARGGLEAVGETLRYLERQAFKASLER